MTHYKGQIIRDYVVTSDFGTASAGQCLWGFASRNGEEFFVKKFLSPVFPQPDSPGSPKSKDRRRKECEKFEAKHRAIQKALSECGEGGLLVKTVDFFRHENHYYKVCQKVDTSSMSDKIHTLPYRDRIFSMLTASFALQVLHSNKITHFDIKPDNILVQSYAGKQVSKIIDFDDSILEGIEFSHDQLVGDIVYYSPELASYVSSEGKSIQPGYKSDIFSLGLVFNEYWTGTKPDVSPFNYPYEAVLEGSSVKPNISVTDVSDSIKKSSSRVVGVLSKSVRKPVKKTDPAVMSNALIESNIFYLVSQMLDANPENRPTARQVHQNLKNIRDGKPLSLSEISKKSTKSKPSSATSSEKGSSRVKINF